MYDLSRYAKKYWSHVTYPNPLDPNACWGWDGITIGKGYGNVVIYGLGLINSRGNLMGAIGAHRFSYLLHNPEADIINYLVLHKCDNPACTNPKHLWLGTHSDNIQDAIAKGRHKTNGYELRTHCPKGHLYTEENSVWDKYGKRCRRCRELRSRVATMEPERLEKERARKRESSRKKRVGKNNATAN